MCHSADLNCCDKVKPLLDQILRELSDKLLVTKLDIIEQISLKKSSDRSTINDQIARPANKKKSEKVNPAHSNDECKPTGHSIKHRKISPLIPNKHTNKEPAGFDIQNSSVIVKNRAKNDTSDKRKHSNFFLGRLENTNIKAVETKPKTGKVFVSRVDPKCSGEQIYELIQKRANIECRVFKMKTKFDTYASFVIETQEFYVDNLLIPELWPKGLMVRKFVGRLVYENATEIRYDTASGIILNDEENSVTDVHNNTIISEFDENDDTMTNSSLHIE
jgi:hypothetical protein